MDSDALGVLLRRYRESALLTQEELAGRTGMSARTIRRLESEELRRPRVSTVRLLAAALGLSAAEQAILVAARDGELPVDTGPVVIPRQVPAAPALFIGRRDELDRLEAVLSADTPLEEGHHGRSTLILMIGGAGGIGKTWLALHWAHHHLNRFPDGQLFVDLNGFSPTGQPAGPADVLGRFLDALGIDHDRQPTDLTHRTDLYRSVVANKRMLVILDNAANADQVIPLLPGGHHCAVVITSRNQLRGVVAGYGARPIHLDVLTDVEARTLLTTALGPDRVAAHEPAVAKLIEMCGGFPLALGVIAARAAANRHLLLEDAVDELRTFGADALDGEDHTASLPAVLSWSLHHLTDRQQFVFALLGIAPGPDIGLPAAAQLAGRSVRETHAVLQGLADNSLIDRTPGSRFAMHDLVRAYAATVADAQHAEVRELALRRVIDFYTHTAHAADHLLEPHRDFVPLDPPPSGVHVHPLSDAVEALAWFDTEHACLLAAQHTATTRTWHSTVWHLAEALDVFHHRRGHHHHRLTVWQAAVDTATHLPDLTAQTLAHLYLGLAQAELSRHEDALSHLRHALTLAEHHHDPTLQARTHHVLARTWELHGDIQQALDHARHALNLFRGLHQTEWKADALNAVGWYAALLGDYNTALDHCDAALTLHQSHHDPDSEADTLDNLGYINHHSGRHTEAITSYRQALALRRDHGNTHQAANTFDRLGHLHVSVGQTEQARTAWVEALSLYREQARHNDADRIRRQLDHLDTNTPE